MSRPIVAVLALSCLTRSQGHVAPELLDSCPSCRQPALLAAWSLLGYSLPAHKEFRFLLPALQLLMPYCGLAAARLWGSEASPGAPKRRQRGGEAARTSGMRWWRWAAAACLWLQLPVAAYFLLVHQG